MRPMYIKSHLFIKDWHARDFIDSNWTLKASRLLFSFHCSLNEKGSPRAQNFKREREFQRYLNMAIWSVMPPLLVSVCPVSYLNLAIFLIARLNCWHEPRHMVQEPLNRAINSIARLNRCHEPHGGVQEHLNRAIFSIAMLNLSM